MLKQLFFQFLSFEFVSFKISILNSPICCHMYFYLYSQKAEKKKKAFNEKCSVFCCYQFYQEKIRNQRKGTNNKFLI